MSDKPSLPELPAEFTTPSENLKPGPRESDFYMETTGYGPGNARVTSWIGRNVAGISVGVLQLRAVLPMVPGHIANGTTFDFPLLYREMLPNNPYTIMALDPDPVSSSFMQHVYESREGARGGEGAAGGGCGCN